VCLQQSPKNRNVRAISRIGTGMRESTLSKLGIAAADNVTVLD